MISHCKTTIRGKSVQPDEKPSFQLIKFLRNWLFIVDVYISNEKIIKCLRHDRTISILFIQLYSGTSFSAEIICKTIRHVMQSSFRKNGVISSCKVQKYRHSLTWLQRRFRVNRFCSRSHARSNFPFSFTFTLLFNLSFFSLSRAHSR